MLQLVNRTGLAASVFAAPDARGVETLSTLVKGTFDLRRLDARGTPAPAGEQVAVAATDEHHGDPETTSIRVPSDFSLGKRGTDVLLAGTAHAPRGRPLPWMDVVLAAGPVRKTVRVFGDRAWDAGAAATTPPVPFARMPLVWERAYGGGDGTDVEERNPVGRGFVAPGGGAPPDGLPLPNLEDPFHPLTSWEHAPPPAAFAPVAPHWLPRRAWAGTYDDAWREGRAPYLPEDFDPRFFQVAPEGLAAPGFLAGGEPVEVRGATPDGPLRFVLPALALRVAYRVDGGTEAQPAVLETVLVEPDAGRVVLVWRAALACDKRLLRVREITVRVNEEG
jgi:hypothetical protein